ncbi:glycoprotein 3-alpha-L-fucosyltransferase A-like [Actinia tenebrosa]|uniref:Fucosyltransferase n=1 Tax=Actinia tenebrosa TaxID=6105 RepID=A0A6P8II96_ACTTE|nr:glycoprotein 3-alpha-L-fucosyltransferase A-like [Actinia tenebrosa]
MEKVEENNEKQARLNETMITIRSRLLEIKNTGKQVKMTATVEGEKHSKLHPQNKSQEMQYKLVLIYTPWFGIMPWPQLKNTYNFTHFNGKSCKESRCRLTYDKKDLARSDAVMFHGTDLPSVNTMKEMSRNRSLNQRWVFFIHENPYYTFINTNMYNGFFNWTMTYRRDSDIFAPYRYYTPLDSTETSINKKQRNYAQGKDKFIAWMVSNCGKLRDKVTAKLLKYVNVTVFGPCGKHFNQTNRCNRKTRDCEKLLKRFKFYLSFENRNCIDYVTEKYWYTSFNHDMVPIVLGPLKYDSKIAIPDSYINVMDFPSLKDLASYLKYLDKNDTAYNEYFQWKRKYKLGNMNPWKCQMCADLHNPNLPPKVYDDLGSYWDKKKSCEKYEEEVRKLLQR